VFEIFSNVEGRTPIADRFKSTRIVKFFNRVTAPVVFDTNTLQPARKCHLGKGKTTQIAYIIQQPFKLRFCLAE
jgi:hypothetical protein